MKKIKRFFGSILCHIFGHCYVVNPAYNHDYYYVQCSRCGKTEVYYTVEVGSKNHGYPTEE